MIKTVFLTDKVAMKFCPTLPTKLQCTAQTLTTTSLVGLIAACTPTLNSEKLETKIQQWLEQEKNIEAEWVSCPTNIKIDVGSTIDCEAKREDGTWLNIAVHLDSEEGDVSLKLDENRDQDTSTILASSKKSSNSKNLIVTPTCGTSQIRYAIAYIRRHV